MHATQHQGTTSPEPTPVSGTSAADQLVGLLSNPEVFRAVIAAQVPANDVDGYVVTDAGLHALAGTGTGAASGTAARVLRSAARYLERYGWIQGAYYDATSGSFTPPACLVGAIGMACYGGPVDAPAQHFDDPGFLDFEEAVLHLDRYLMVEDGSESYEFNDAKGRTADDVITVLRKAAAMPADEAEDALRAIHLDAEHKPGDRADCPACLSNCFCVPGSWCVRCAQVTEQALDSLFGGDVG